jgi:hypothetical protein
MNEPITTGPSSTHNAFYSILDGVYIEKRGLTLSSGAQGRIHQNVRFR